MTSRHPISNAISELCSIQGRTMHGFITCAKKVLDEKKIEYSEDIFSPERIDLCYRIVEWTNINGKGIPLMYTIDGFAKCDNFKYDFPCESVLNIGNEFELQVEEIISGNRDMYIQSRKDARRKFGDSKINSSKKKVYRRIDPLINVQLVNSTPSDPIPNELVYLEASKILMEIFTLMVRANVQEK